MKKWEDKRNENVRGQKGFYFLYFVFGWRWKKKRNCKKMSLYKFTYMPLLKNDAQLK